MGGDFVSMYLLFILETESHYVAHAHLRLTILLSRSSVYWGYRCGLALVSTSVSSVQTGTVRRTDGTVGAVSVRNQSSVSVLWKGAEMQKVLQERCTEKPRTEDPLMIRQLGFTLSETNKQAELPYIGFSFGNGYPCDVQNGSDRTAVAMRKLS